MSIIDDKAPIIIDHIDKIVSDFQKRFKTKVASKKISTKPRVLVHFCKFHYFTKKDLLTPQTSSTAIGLQKWYKKKSQYYSKEVLSSFKKYSRSFQTLFSVIWCQLEEQRCSQTFASHIKSFLCQFQLYMLFMLLKMFSHQNSLNVVHHLEFFPSVNFSI